MTRNTELAIEDANSLDRDNFLDFAHEEVYRRRSALSTRREVQAIMPERPRFELRMEIFLDVQDVHAIRGFLLGLGSCNSLTLTLPLLDLKRPMRESINPS